MKCILSWQIYPEQFFVLEGWHSHEVVGVAQEGLHSINIGNLRAIIVKVDLSKAFNQVIWLYIRLLPIHLGFCHQFVIWVINYINSLSFAILINCFATPFFKLERRSKQGFPLCPFYHVTSGYVPGLNHMKWFELRLFPRHPTLMFLNPEFGELKHAMINGPGPSFRSTVAISSNSSFQESLDILLWYLLEYYSSSSCGLLPRVPSRSNGLDSNHFSWLHEDLCFLLENLPEFQLPDLLILCHLSPPNDGRFYGLWDFNNPSTFLHT
jgi:hypothetical protein